MRRQLYIILFILTIPAVTFGQSGKKTGMIKGKLINKITKAAYNDLKIIINGLNVFTSSDGDGEFMFSEVPYGNQTLIVAGNSIYADTINVNLDKDVLEIGEQMITPNDENTSVQSIEIPTIAIDENSSSSDDDGVITNSAGLLAANRDPFVYTAAYIFGAYSFQPRGARNQSEIEVNGIPINNAETGNASWGQQLGDLNDVFRDRNIKYGLAPSAYTFGGLGGSTYIAASAADQRKGTNITYTNADRTYRNRIMVTENSGLSKKGWAYTISASKRWADQSYRPGTFFDGYAYFASVSKVIGKSQFNFTTVGVPTIQGKAGTATQEVYDLAKNNFYNPLWGYQKGQVRDSRIQNIFQPIYILNYEYNPNDKTRWNTAIGFQNGIDKTSNLDYYNAGSPYGNYYKNLPSYSYTMMPPQTAIGNAVKQAIMNNPDVLQINWDNLYNSNYNNIQNVYNINNALVATGKQSLYVEANKVNDLKKFTFNTNIEHSVNEHVTVYGGATLLSQSTEIYKQLSDLMGGDFFVNFNQFASQQAVGVPSYNYNNLNNTNPIVKVGDKYGYDYSIRINNAFAWGQAVFNYDKFDFFASIIAGDYSFSRYGYFKNGLFANNSAGASSIQNFLNYGFKGGATYKINGRNFVFLNAAYTTTPPTADNTYISAETRNFTVTNPTVQKNMSLEGGYLLKSQKISARAVGYLNNVTDATEIKRFYNDDPAFYTFVNYAMQHENISSIGTELMVDVKITAALSVTGVAAIGQAIYSNRPDISVYLDNDTAQHAIPTKAYIQNYNLAVGPQSAYTAGVNYRFKGWYTNLNFNYLDRNYVQINPNRRTLDAVGFYQAGTINYNNVVDQEKLPAAFTVDLHFGKSIQLSRLSKMVKKISGNNTNLYINGGIGNLLNNTNIITRGYEQLRYDYTNHIVGKFPTVYQYGYGINYFVNITLRF